MSQRQGTVMWAAVALMVLFMPTLLVLSRPCTGQGAHAKVNPKDGAEMVFIPAGEFLMGSTAEQIDALLASDAHLNSEWFQREMPQRRVYLDAYWMYKTPVTVAQYKKFCEATKRKKPAVLSWGWTDDHPIVNVSWDDAMAYARWAGGSLPTEAQWEKAARGFDGRVYPWGDTWDASRCANAGVLPSTTSVGSYPSGASPYGCLDMTGYVWQWCADWYEANYYMKGPARNPPGPKKGRHRVLRGCGWGHLDLVLRRCANRYRLDPRVRADDIGFRCVCRADSH